MAQASQSPRQQAMQIAGLVLTSVVLLNAAFYFLSDLYFADRVDRFGSGELAQLGGVRIAFGIFTASIGCGAILASFAPDAIGHGLASAAALASLIAGVAALDRGLPSVLGVTMIIVGVLFGVMVWRSLARSRAGWAFLIALCGVYALVLLFGAPKVRGLLGIGLWHALIIPGLLAVAATALAMVRDRYRETDDKGKAKPAPARAAAAAAKPLDPEERERRRKAGVTTMAAGLVLMICGGIFVATIGITSGMAATFLGFALIAAGIGTIVRGYLLIPR